MMKFKAFLGACALACALPAFAAATDDAHAAREARALATLAEHYHEAQLRFDPVYSGTLNGDNRYDDRLPVTIAPDQRRARFAMYRDVKRQLAAIDRAALPEADALTWDVLGRELDGRLAFERFDDHLLPLQQMDTIPLLLANFAGGQAEQPLKTVAQHEAFLKRLAALPAWDAQAVANMREGARRGIVQPRPVVVAVLAQLGPMCSGRVEDNPFLAPVRGGTAALSDADRARLDAAYRATVLGQVAPAMCRLRDFVEREYLPAARSSVGWSALPDGAAWYRQWVRDQTTTELGPDEIHAMGLAEVARIQGELARVAPRLGYTGDPKQLLSWVRGNPAFLPFRDADLIVGAYRDIDGEVRAQLPTLFHRLPRASLDIRLEPELTRSTASDHYSPPAQDGSRPGVFWAVVNDPAIYDSSIMAALFLHEGEPGHHLQMALQQELPLPAFRKSAWINAYGEGWALYAESLGRELGLYDDPGAYVGYLRQDVFRAARLVVDTGLHAKAWSREQAIAYLKETTGLNDAQCASQVDRYLAWPAQALGYKLGALRILALRERARHALGERFELAAFHDLVLGEGPLPLALLEERVDRWIAQRAR